MTSLRDLPLFAVNTTPPHVRDSETSRDAAEAIKDRVPSLQRKILDCIRQVPWGLTCDDVEALLQIKHQTCSARFRDLAACQPPLIQKVLLDDGKYARRKTRSGCGAYIYVATEAA